MVASPCPNDRFRNLTPKRQALMRLIQCVGFGSITFQVWGGEPELSRPHHTTHTRRLVGGHNGPQPEANCADFELKREHVALLSQLELLPDGTRVKVKLAHGLPGPSIDIEEDHQAA